jgi:hypothetical protein
MPGGPARRVDSRAEALGQNDERYYGQADKRADHQRQDEEDLFLVFSGMQTSVVMKSAAISYRIVHLLPASCREFYQIE